MMPTSPEAAGVVERLRRWSDDPAVTASHTEPLKADVRALLPVVEALEYIAHRKSTYAFKAGRSLDYERVAQQALEGLESKDAEGAKP